MDQIKEPIALLSGIFSMNCFKRINKPASNDYIEQKLFEPITVVV